MSDFQTFYMVWLALLFFACRPVLPMWIVLGNAMATLAVAGLMDAQAISGHDARFFMALADAATATVLLVYPGYARVIGAAFAVSFSIQMPALLGSAGFDTTFPVVYILNCAQLGVLTIGGVGGGTGLRAYPRRRAFVDRASAPGRSDRMAKGHVAETLGSGIGDGR